MADVSSSSISSLAPRLPMESKEERRKRRQEKRRIKEEHNRRKEQRAKDRDQRTSAAATSQNGSPEKMGNSERPLGADDDQGDSTAARKEAKRLKKLKKAQEKQRRKERELHRVQSRAEGQGSVGPVPTPVPKVPAAETATPLIPPRAPVPVAVPVSAPAAPAPTTPAFAKHRSPFAPRPPVPAPLASSPPFFPRQHPMSSQSQSETEGGISAGQPSRDHSSSPVQQPRIASSSPAFDQNAESDEQPRDKSTSPDHQPHDNSSSLAAMAVAISPSVATPPYDASDFPPGFDMSALEDVRPTQSSSPAPQAMHPRKQPTAAALDAILRSNSNANASASASRGRVSSKRSAANESISKSKEATMTDAAGLTEKQILSEKLYQPHQIKWLEEAGMLTTVYRGKFSSAESAAIDAAFESWCTAQGITRTEGIELIHNRTPEQAQMYADLTTHLTASVDGRALRAVRRFVMENFHEAKTGPWSDEEIQALRKAHAEVGPKWSVIAQRLGRLSRDVRVKYRDYVERRPSASASTSTSTSTSANGSKPTASTSSTTLSTGPWSKKDMQKLEQAVRAQCESLSLDIDGPNLPWKSISLTLDRSTHGCLSKWGEMRAKQKAGQDPYAFATGEAAYNAARDDVVLVKRLLSRQRDVLARNDAKLIRWSRVIANDTEDEEEEEDTLPFSKEIVSKAFSRLMKRLHTDHPAIASLPLLDQLQTHALLATEAAHMQWQSHPSSTSRGPKSGSTWSQERHAAVSLKRVSRDAEKEARKTARLEKRKEKEKRKEIKEIAKARSGTTVASQMKGKDGGMPASEEEDDDDDEAYRLKSSSRKRRRFSGPAVVDLGDAIDSDEE